MATIKIAPDIRRKRSDGSCQIKIFVFHRSGQRCVSTGLYVAPEDWDDARGEVRNSHRLCRQLNVRVGRLRVAVQEAFLGLRHSDGLAETVEAVKSAVRRENGDNSEADASGDEQEAPRVVDVARRYAGMKADEGTRRTYERTVRYLGRFRPESGLGDVGKGWLMEFDAMMALTAPSPNARALHMRNLRAVFNFAIDEGLTLNYPFRKYRIRTVATAKRSLNAKQMRRLLTVRVEEWQAGYRDFFALSFFLIGINAKDLLYLPANADETGRVEFNRAKTKKLYSIRVEPEAAEIVERYRGVGYMLNILDNRRDYLQYIRQCNHALQMIGTESRKGCKPIGEALYPELTTYWARHSWATIAAELDIPKETIAAALGHDMGNSTTAIYINFNRRKVDEANRRVIDYVMYGRR